MHAFSYGHADFTLEAQAAEIITLIIPADLGWGCREPTYGCEFGSLDIGDFLWAPVLYMIYHWHVLESRLDDNCDTWTFETDC